MKTRILVAAIGLPLLLIVLLAMPPIATAILLAAMCLIAVHELLVGTGICKDVPVAVVTALMALFVCLWSSGNRNLTHAVGGIWLFFMALFGLMIASHGKLPLQSVCVAAFGGLIIPLMLSALTRILTMDFGRFYILVPLIFAFATDSAAYFAGRFLGKHKMAPIISPHKTWEGVAGGVLGCVAMMLIYCAVMDFGFQFRVNYGYAVLYAVIGSATCVLGDLSFSVIKRQTGIKDFGTLLPGHGGILDRFDSMVFVAPLAEVLIALLPLLRK